MHRPAAANPPAAETILLTVPKDTPLQVALDKEVRIRKEGQPIRGRLIEPVYAFDKQVIPVGTEVAGQITEIGKISGGRRAAAALDANFTPARKVRIEFSEMALPDGKRIPIETRVAPGSGEVIQLVSAAEAEHHQSGAENAAAQKTREAKQRARQAWDNAMKQVHEPGKIHRLERYGIALLPVHPQYIDAGTVYSAELTQPLDFGSEPLTPELASSLNAAAVDGSVVHARLITALSSATAQKGDAIEAIVSQPVFDGDRLIIPEGSELKGSVLRVRPARHMSRNGQLRVVFHELSLPNGIEQKVDALLAGVEAGKADNVKLDSEGGAEATSPKTRYLKTAVSISLAAFSGKGDTDAKVPNSSGTTAGRIAGGAGGFKLVGTVLGALVHSHAFGYSMGAYGAGMSIYANFVARGRDVVFPKDTAMEISIGTQPPPAPTTTSVKN